MQSTRQRPPLRRRAWSGAIATLVVAGGITAIPSPALAAGSPEASAVLGAQPSYDGIVRAWPGDKDKDPAHAVSEQQGTGCWTMSGDPYNNYLYVDVDDAVKPAGAKRALVTLSYFDAGQTNLEIQYDGNSSPWAASSNVALAGSNTWVTTQLELTDIRFANRSNGADFRVNVKASAATIPPICFSKVEVSFTDAPVLSVTSPSLLFEEGEGPITFASAADSVDYTIGDASGAAIDSGSLDVTDDAAELPISELPPGYYSLTATADSGAPVTRTTNFGIVTPTPDGALDPDSFFGVGMHYGWQPVETEEALLDAMALVGWGNTRSDVNWSGVEKAPGVFDFASSPFDRGARSAAERGITSMANWGYRNPLYDGGKTPSSPEGIAAFANFAKEASLYFDDVTPNFGVQNEYNSTGFNDGACGISAACYIDILEQLWPAVEAANPDTNVIGPTTAGTSLPWAQDFVAQGGLGMIDTYSTNFYGYGDPAVQPENTDLTGAFPQLVSLIEANQGDRDIPIWVTENGAATYPSGITEVQQADRIVRAQLLARDAGADKLFIYDALDDGTDRTNREHNFGQFRRPGAGITGIAPKPSAVATAVLIRAATGREQGEREDLGAESVYSYPLVGADSTIRAMWSTDVATVRIATDAPLSLSDEFGAVTTLTPREGEVFVDLDGSPVYLEGAPESITVVESPFGVSTSSQSVTGADLPVTVTAGRGAQRHTVTVSGATAELVGSEDTSSAEVEVPPATKTAVRELTATIADKHGVYARLRASSNVVTPMVVTGRPVVVSGDSGYSYALDIAVTNNDAAAELTVDTLSWRAGAKSGSIPDPFTVAPSGTETTRVAVDGVTPFASYSYSTAAFSGDRRATNSGNMSWSPIEPDGASTFAPISLDETGRWVSLRGGTRNGSADLGGTVKFSHTPEAFVATAIVTDEQHSADRGAGLAWQADSIQFSLYSDFPSVAGAVRTEVSAALAPSGPVVFTHAAPPGQPAGPTPGAVADIVRDDAAGTTSYRVTVPWSSLGYETPPASVFGLSFLVNDADASTGIDARDGYLEWGGGVGAAPKNPSLFRSAQLVAPGN